MTLTKIHNFKDSYTVGKAGEDAVANYFISLGYEVSRVPKGLQKTLMYDLYVINRDKGKEFCIEVKTEHKAEETGNICYEIEVDGKPGWCLKYSELSNVLILWYLPVRKHILVFPAKRLKDIEYRRYRQVTVQNVGYIAKNHLIPLTDMYEVCKIVELS